MYCQLTLPLAVYEDVSSSSFDNIRIINFIRLFANPVDRNSI